MPTQHGQGWSRVSHHLLLHLAPPLLLPASFSCTRIAWQGGHGLDCVLRLQEVRRSSASYAEQEEQLHQQQPKKPQRSRDAQLTRGGGNGQGGEERPGWKEGEGQQWKEQQQPTQQREPPAIQEQQLPAGVATIGAAAVSRSSSRRQEMQPSAEVAALGRSSSPRQEQHQQ